MGVRETTTSLYHRANGSFGRRGIVYRAILLFVLPFVSLGALAVYLASTADWYWHHFGWLGILFAVLLSWGRRLGVRCSSSDPFGTLDGCDRSSGLNSLPYRHQRLLFKQEQERNGSLHGRPWRGSTTLELIKK